MEENILSEYSLFSLIYPDKFNKIFLKAKYIFSTYANSFLSQELFCFLLENILITGFILIIILQLCISSLPEDAEYFIKLPSIKYIKKKFINSFIGKSSSACIVIFYLFETKVILENSSCFLDFFTLINDLTEINDFNFRFQKRNKKLNFKKYIKFQMYAFWHRLGNFFLVRNNYSNNDFNFIKDFGILETINFMGFEIDFWRKLGINIDYVLDKIRYIYLSDDLGLPIQCLICKESNKIFSKLETEILGGKLIRIQK